MTIYAHDWNAIGSDERIPRWPSKINEKRQLRVTINSWVGISAGARHTYVEVKEEDNMWWSEKENTWVRLSCDGSRSGYSMHCDVFSEEEAIALAKYFIQLIAGKQRRHHTVTWEGPGKPRWAR